MGRADGKRYPNEKYKQKRGQVGKITPESGADLNINEPKECQVEDGVECHHHADGNSPHRVYLPEPVPYVGLLHCAPLRLPAGKKISLLVTAIQIRRFNVFHW